MWKHIKVCWSTHSSVSKCIKCIKSIWFRADWQGFLGLINQHLRRAPPRNGSCRALSWRIRAWWIGDKSLQKLTAPWGSVRLPGTIRTIRSQASWSEFRRENHCCGWAPLIKFGLPGGKIPREPVKDSKGTFWCFLYSDSALSEEWTCGKTLKLDGTRMGWNVVPMCQQEKTWQRPLDASECSVSSLNPSSGDGLKATMAGKVSTFFPGISPVSWPTSILEYIEHHWTISKRLEHDHDGGDIRISLWKKLENIKCQKKNHQLSIWL